VLKVLEQLQQPEYTMIVLVAATGIRASELLGLRWFDIKIRETYVHGNIQSDAKTKASKSTVTMHPVLAQLLKDWRAETAYASDDDYVFASSKLGGRKPRIGSMVVEDYCNQQRSGRAFLRSRMENATSTASSSSGSDFTPSGTAHIMAHVEWGESPDRSGYAAVDKPEHACPLRARIQVGQA
jgi:integrase